MPTQFIEVSDYDPSWTKWFDFERARLAQQLGRVAQRIHHIGSTAVPGLAAKPVIDILMEVSSLADLDRHQEDWAELGYVAKGEFGIPGRRYFKTSRNKRVHHVHAYAARDMNVVRHLAFRDFLRANPKIASEYGALKKRIAATCSNDMDRYCDGKDSFVKRVEALALQAHELGASRQR